MEPTASDISERIVPHGPHTVRGDAFLSVILFWLCASLSWSEQQKSFENAVIDKIETIRIQIQNTDDFSPFFSHQAKRPGAIKRATHHLVVKEGQILLSNHSVYLCVER
jgi:hypothetical protein